MTTTKKELAEKLRRALPGLDHIADWPVVASTVAELLGVELAPERPASGTWHLTRTEGWPAWVDTEGDLSVIEPDGGVDTYWSGDNDWPDLDPATPPARVVPAAPVELAEEQVGELWDEVTGDDPNTSIWYDYSTVSKRRWTALANAALTAHAHAASVELPGRDEVQRVMWKAIAGRNIDDAVDAVMALLGGGSDA